MPFAISRRTSLGMVALIVSGLSIFLGLTLLYPALEQRTDNAYIRADSTLVAPRISGHVVELLVDDNQQVVQGQLLARLDPRDYEAARAAARADALAATAKLRRIEADIDQQQARIEAARAQVDASQADHAFAQQQLRRYEGLSRQGAGSMELAQEAHSRVGVTRASLEGAKASLQAARQQVDVLRADHEQAQAELGFRQARLEEAELQLSYTEIRAPISGMVGRRSVRVGTHVQPGETLLAVVPLQAAYVVANFQETQLTHVRVGQPVSITVDTFPGVRLRGHVDSLAPASGLSFAPLQPDNATGNFTKIVQRIPVKIRLEPGQAFLDRLRVGMSVIATVDTRGAGQPPGLLDVVIAALGHQAEGQP